LRAYPKAGIMKRSADDFALAPGSDEVMSGARKPMARSRRAFDSMRDSVAGLFIMAAVPLS